MLTLIPNGQDGTLNSVLGESNWSSLPKPFILGIPFSTIISSRDLSQLLGIFLFSRKIAFFLFSPRLPEFTSSVNNLQH